MTNPSVNITVTQDHWDTAMARREDLESWSAPRNCAVALAVQEQLGTEVSVGTDTITIGRTFYRMDSIGQRLVSLFDFHRPAVLPTTFTIRKSASM